MAEPLRILVVDDDTSIRYVCAQTLRAEGHEVVPVETGEAALEEAGKSPFDLVVTDLVMPGKSGLETFQAIRQLHPDILGIIITGRGTMDDAIEAVGLGFSAFLAKPFSPSELVMAVTEAVDKHRLQADNTRLRALLELHEISEAATGSLDLPVLLNRILEGALRETRASRGSIMLFDEDSNELRVGAAVGLPAEVVASATRRLGEGVSGWIAEHRKPLVLHAGDPASTNGMPDLLGVQSLREALCLPLISKGNLVGVLNLSSTEEEVTFSEGDVELLQILASQAATAIENSRLHVDLQSSYLSTIHALAAAIEEKDPYTRGHSANVAELAAAIGQRLGLSSHDIDGLRVAGVLHDVGKIGIPDRILLKPDRLDDEEFATIRQHPAKGVRILDPAQIPHNEVLTAVSQHHERIDGKGYPDNLKGDDISLYARIMSVADCYDAMTSDRAYRKGMPKEQALSIMEKIAGSQLDPELVPILAEQRRESAPAAD